MTKKTKDAIQTSAVIVLVIVAVFALWIYPLNQAGKIVSRPETEITADSLNIDSLGLSGESFKILTDDNLNMAGYYLKAKLDSTQLKPSGTFILIHGLFGGMKSQVEKARELTSASYNVIMYDQRGYGRSDGKYRSCGYFEADDLQSLLSRFYLEDRLVHPVIIWGEDQGATAAIRTVVDDKRIDFLIAENPVVDGYDWQDRIIAHRDMSAPRFMYPLIWWWMKQTSSYEIRVDETDISDQFGQLTEKRSHAFLIITTGSGDTPDNSQLAQLRDIGGNWFIIPNDNKPIFSGHKTEILSRIYNMIHGSE